MSASFYDLAFTPSVLAEQQRHGSRDAYRRARDAAPDEAGLGADERAFIEARDHFYLATVSEAGWPYVQHRGGPPGFISALDARTLAFVELIGNRQYVTAGNTSRNPRCALLFMDYAAQQRLKVMATLRHEPLEARPALAASLLRGLPVKRAEALAVLEVAAFDWNCAKGITPRYTADEVERAVEPLRARIRELEAKRR
ncbi:MAG TPA: pyridoxamine 5'-phosphate oxidase family protein [Myxococcales bacterium]